MVKVQVKTMASLNRPSVFQNVFLLFLLFSGLALLWGRDTFLLWTKKYLWTCFCRYICSFSFLCCLKWIIPRRFHNTHNLLLSFVKLRYSGRLWRLMLVNPLHFYFNTVLCNTFSLPLILFTMVLTIYKTRWPRQIEGYI